MQTVIKDVMDEVMKNMNSLQNYDYSKTLDLLKNVNNPEVGQQLLDFQKNVFENTYNAMVTIQEQSDKITDTIIKENTVISADSKKLIKEWRGVIKKGQNELKKSVDDSFKKAETYLADAK